MARVAKFCTALGAALGNNFRKISPKVVCITASVPVVVGFVSSAVARSSLVGFSLYTSLSPLPVLPLARIKGKAYSSCSNVNIKNLAFRNAVQNNIGSIDSDSASNGLSEAAIAKFVNPLCLG